MSLADDDSRLVKFVCQCQLKEGKELFLLAVQIAGASGPETNDEFPVLTDFVCHVTSCYELSSRQWGVGGSLNVESDGSETTKVSVNQCCKDVYCFL